MPAGTATLPMNRITPRSEWQGSGMERQRSVKIIRQPFVGPFIPASDVRMIAGWPEGGLAGWSYTLTEDQVLPGTGCKFEVSMPEIGYPVSADNAVVLRVQVVLPEPALEETHTEPATAVVALGDGVAEFIASRKLTAGLRWLQSQLLQYFPCAAFELNLSRGDEPDDLSLGLKVYSAEPAAEFRAKARALCETMHLAGHHQFYLQLGIFQRRGKPDEQPGIPWFSAATEG